MKKCVWVRPEVVVQIDFREWTPSDHLRHAKFARIRFDKDAREVSRKVKKQNKHPSIRAYPRSLVASKLRIDHTKFVVLAKANGSCMVESALEGRLV
jgi:hypothetical protein